VTFLVLIICVLVRVAFITLLERKVLGYIQIRKGPNKVGVIGLLQPFADAVKLFTKENSWRAMLNLVIYYLAPILSLMLMLIYYMIYTTETSIEFSYEVLYFIVISSLSIYTVMGAGWASNSKYALLGAYRRVAQTISYEVGFSFILLSILFLSSSFNFVHIKEIQEYVWFTRFIWNICLVWIVVILAEINRTPFDFAEGESELVSGFNVEYGGGGFALLFIAEYGNIIFIRFVTSIFFFSGSGLFIWKMILILILYLWVRGTLVRFRYDNLIRLAWKVILPFSIFLLMFVLPFFRVLLNSI